MKCNLKNVAAVLAACALCAAAAGPASAHLMRFENDSGFVIERIHVSPVWEPEWGVDRLGRRVLVDGAAFSVNLPGGRYDVRLVDEDGDVCVLHNYEIYSGRTLTIDRPGLLRCERG